MTADPAAALAAIAEIRRILGEGGGSARLPGDRAPVSLPALTERPAELPASTLRDVLRARRSWYSFGEAPSDERLATYLRWACGSWQRAAGENGRRLLTPSAGGQLAHSVYLLSAGRIIRYDRVHHVGLASGRYDREVLASALTQPEFARRTDTFVVAVADPRCGVKTYGARHYRTLHVEAGVLAAHLGLVAEAMNLACCVVSGIDDDRLHALLDLDAEQFVTVVLPLGEKPS